MEQLPSLPPEEMRVRQTKHQAVIELTARIHDWQTLLFAVDDMIADQRGFVEWWDEHIGVRHGAGRGHKINADPHAFTMEDAEKLTGIKQWQVSRWNKGLADEEGYRNNIIAVARRKAGFDKDPMAAQGQPGRDGPDFWPTPDCLIEAACGYVVPYLPAATIWECAAGDGRLGRAIAATGRTVVMTDKYPQDGSEPLDFTTDPPPQPGLIAMTNSPFNQIDAFLGRGLALLDGGAIIGLVLLLRHDHLMGGSKAGPLNRALKEVHCNWRPVWIPGSLGNPRWGFSWVEWGAGPRRPPVYLARG